MFKNSINYINKKFNIKLYEITFFRNIINIKLFYLYIKPNTVFKRTNLIILI